MAFKGDLKNVHLADLFQTLAQNDQEGVLTISSRNETRRVYFHKGGVTLLDPAVAGRRRLGDILLEAGLVNENQIEEAVREQARSPRFLGEILVEKGLLRREDLHTLLQLQIEEELYDLFRIPSGAFEFKEGAAEIPVNEDDSFNVDGIVLEAARRMDEWEQIERYVPNLQDVYVVTDAGLKAQDESERELLARIDGRRSVQDLSDSMFKSVFLVAKLVSRLAVAGRVRLASPVEMIESAHGLLEQSRTRQAVKLLHRARIQIPDDPSLLSDLASLYFSAGDTASAAQARVKQATLLRDQSRPSEARQVLEAAAKETPDSIEVLATLCQILRQQCEREPEVAALQQLSNLYAGAGRPEGAAQCCERLLEIEPGDAANRRRLVDFLLRARQKDRAIEILYAELNAAKAEGRTPELIQALKRIVAIDSSRADCKRMLGKLLRTRSERTMRAILYVFATLVGVGVAGGFFYLSFQRNQGLQEVQTAGEMFQSGDFSTARQQLQEILQNYSSVTVENAARELLDNVERQAFELAKVERNKREQAIEERLSVYLAHLASQELDAALELLLKLLEGERQPDLRIRLLANLKSLTQVVNQQAARIKQAVQAYRPLQNDVDILSHFDDLASAFNPGVLPMVTRLVQSATEAGSHTSGEIKDALTSITEGAVSWKGSIEGMAAEVARLEVRFRRLETLAGLSDEFIQATQAADRGDLEQAEPAFEALIAAYGDGELLSALTARLNHIKEAKQRLQNIEQFAAADQLEKAHEAARRVLEDFADLSIAQHVRFPVHVATLPSNVLVHRGEEVLGRTPAVLWVEANSRVEIDLRRPGFETLRISVDALKPRVDHRLQKQCFFTIDLGAPVDCALSYDAPRDILYVAARNGVFYRISAARGEVLGRFDSKSLPGSTASPLLTDKGVLFLTAEGTAWMLSRDAAFSERWRKGLGAPLRHPAVVFHNEILVFPDATSIVALSPDSGEILWSSPLADRMLAQPAQHGSFLWVPYKNGLIEKFDLVGHTSVATRSIGHEISGSLLANSGNLIVTTTTGMILSLSAADLQVDWQYDAGELLNGDGAFAGHRFAYSVGNKLFDLDLMDKALARVWKSERRLGGVPLRDGESWIVGDESGALLGFDLSSFSPCFKTLVGPQRIVGAPVATALGYAVVCTDGRVQVLVR